jgi:hypothetical protein
LVSPEGWDEGLVKNVARVERTVADKLEHGSMQHVASRLSHDADLSASPLPIFGAVRIGQNVQLADRINT